MRSAFLSVYSHAKSLLSFESESLIRYEIALSASLHEYVRLKSIKPIVAMSVRKVNTVYYATICALICSIPLANMLGFYSATSSNASILILGASVYVLPNAATRVYAYSTLSAFMSDAQVRPDLLPSTYLHPRYPFGVVSSKKLEAICLKYSCDMAAKTLLNSLVFSSLKNSKMYSEETLDMSLSLCPDFELSLAELLEASRCLQ
jgi:hypothetical protein